jgi:hypothetical protein
MRQIQVAGRISCRLMHAAHALLRAASRLFGTHALYAAKNVIGMNLAGV